MRTFADRLIVAKVEKTNGSSGDEIDTKVKVKVKVEVKAEDAEIVKSEDLRLRSLADAAKTVKRESEEGKDDENHINIGEVKVKEEPSARSMRAKRRRMS